MDGFLLFGLHKIPECAEVKMERPVCGWLCVSDNNNQDVVKCIILTSEPYRLGTEDQKRQVPKVDTESLPEFIFCDWTVSD